MKSAVGPAAVKRILSTDPVYVAEDLNEDLIVHPDFFLVGILVNTERESIAKLKQELANCKEQLNAVLAEQNIITYHVPELKSIFFAGDGIEPMMAPIRDNAGMSSMLIRQLDIYAMLALDDPQPHYIFLKKDDTI